MWGKCAVNDPVGIFKEEWIDEEQAVRLAMSLLKCSRNEALLALKEFRDENPDLVMKEQ